MLAGAGVGADPHLGALHADGLGNVRRSGGAKGRQVGAGKADLAVGVQILYLQLVAVGFPGHHRPGIVVILGFCAVVVKAADGVFRLLLERLTQGGIVVAPHRGGEGRHRQQHDKQHHTNGVHHPPLSDTCDFLHGSCCHHLGLVLGPGRPAGIKSPTYIHSPTRW